MDVIIIIALVICGIKVLTNIRDTRLTKYLEEGDKLYKEEHFSEALVFYKKTIRICSASFSSYDKIIKIYVHQGHFMEALSTCDLFIKKFSKKYVPYYTKGRVYEECGELEKALDCYNHAFNIDPKERDICLSRAAILFELHRYEESITQFEMAVGLGCSEGDVCIRKGAALINLCRYSEAEEYYKPIAENYTNGCCLNDKIACAEFYQGKYEASKEIYDSILEQCSSEANKSFTNPLIPEYLDSIIEFLKQNNIDCNELENDDLSNCEKRENILKAMAQNITSAVNDNENYDEEILKWAATRWIEILDCYLSNKQLESIICEKHKTLNSYNIEIHNENILNLQTIHDKKAILNKVGSKIIKSYIINVFYLILILLAGFYVYKGSQNAPFRFDNTFGRNNIEDTEKSLRYMFEGEDLISSGAYNKAIEVFDKALELDPEIPRTHFAKAIALINLKEYNKALDECNIALKINEDFEEALICKGDILVLLNRHYEAINCYERALEVNPENVDAANKKEKCEKSINDKINKLQGTVSLS